MNWTNESTFQDKIFNLMEKVRKHKIYVIAAFSIIIIGLIFLLPAGKDKTEKYIKLMGSNVVNLYVGDRYEELGYEAYDENGDIYTNEVVVDSNLNTNKAGTYEITYNIDDKSVKRKVVVLAKPTIYYEIVLNKVDGEETVYLPLNATFEDPGYEVFDNEGNNITYSIDVKTIGEVDTSEANEYSLIYEFKGPNNEVISAKRTVIVLNNKLNLTLSDVNYTNKDIKVQILVQDEYFDYILLPDGTKIDTKSHTYYITQNGTYNFVLYNKKGLNIEKTLEIDNIDKEKPTGSCTSRISGKKTNVKISSNDNIGIKKFVISGKEYVLNDITLDGVYNLVNAEIHDTAGNITNISCNSTVDPGSSPSDTPDSSPSDTPGNSSKDIILSKNTNNYTNSNISINVKVVDNNFSYLVLPNGNVVYNKNHTYTVEQNGTYTFSSHDKNGQVIQKSIQINNIDKEKPTGICQVKQNSTGTYIEISASDNIGIKNYVYNNKTYITNEISLTQVPSSASVTIYDNANNRLDITCTNLVRPYIKSITKDGVIITITANKSDSNIVGYYFSYTNQRPNKTTGGYVATSNSTIDVVRLPGTTYVWVEDKNGNISEAKTVKLTNDDLLLTKNKNYTILETRLDDYLVKQGWSVDELNKLIARSSRAAGLYTKEAAATSAVALQTVLAQKYKIKIAYWWGGKAWNFGAKPDWGKYKKVYSEKNDKTYYYYGLDCSGFTTWVYVNAGYKIASGKYPSFWSYKKVAFSKENGEVGDFLVTKDGSGRHVKLIIGKTDKAFITAEAKGKSDGMVVDTHSYSKPNGYSVAKGESLMEKYSKIDSISFPSGF